MFFFCLWWRLNVILRHYPLPLICIKAAAKEFSWKKFCFFLKLAQSVLQTKMQELFQSNFRHTICQAKYALASLFIIYPPQFKPLWWKLLSFGRHFWKHDNAYILFTTSFLVLVEEECTKGKFCWLLKGISDFFFFKQMIDLFTCINTLQWKSQSNTSLCNSKPYLLHLLWNNKKGHHYNHLKGVALYKEAVV